jgi:hypothetical protein
MNRCFVLKRGRRSCLWILRIRGSEPVAAVGYPPTEHAYGYRGQERPHNGQGEIRYQAERHESSPENLALHSSIVACASCAACWSA